MLLLLLLLSVIVFTYAQDTLYPDAMGCMPGIDPMADCYGASFVPTEAVNQFRPQGCNTNADCYHMREPPQWCRLEFNQMWSKEGCHCDPKLSMCVVDRITQRPNGGGLMEYTYCYPSQFWFCPPF